MVSSRFSRRVILTHIASAGCLVLLAVLVSYLLSEQLFLAAIMNSDVWFEADIGRVYDNLTDRFSNHYRTKVHPLFSLFGFSAVRLIEDLGRQTQDAVQFFNATLAGVWALSLYVLMMIMRINWFHALLLVGLGISSSSFIYWSTVPETYLLGSISITVCLIVAAWQHHRGSHNVIFVAVVAFSLSITVTNVMVGLFTTFSSKGFRKTLHIAVYAFVAVVILWSVEKLIFPSAEFFVFSAEERRYLLREEAGSILDKLRVFFLTTVVAPEPTIQQGVSDPDWFKLSFQRFDWDNYSQPSRLASGMWLVLLSSGAFCLAKSNGYRNLALVLALSTVGQLALHLFYGEETYLYSLHWLPLFIGISAFAVKLIPSSLATVLLATLLGLTIASNSVSFNLAIAASNDLSYGAPTFERAKLRQMMATHPDGDWPRGLEHSIISVPGSALEYKGYHELGGSFSPGFKSLGISMSVFDESGKFVVSSNSIDPSLVTQVLSLKGGSITTDTPYYRARWSSSNVGEWSLDLSPLGSYRVLVKLSGSGPSGSPMLDTRIQPKGIRVNERFVVEFDKPVASIGYMMEEAPITSISDVMKNSPEPVANWSAVNGFVSLFLSPETVKRESIQLTVSNLKSDPVRRSAAVPTGMPEVSFPDRRFSDSLDAQLFHIRNGLTDNETRPGEPGNYDTDWLRDGAYSVVTLVRAGEFALAKMLLQRFINNDFFGGFGAESDAPGLAIWALNSYSASTADPEFDLRAWEAISRKVDLLLQMLDSETNQYSSFSGSVVPRLRKSHFEDLSFYARKADVGLISGKMDFHDPRLFINAVSYLGLTHAADFASRQGRQNEAEEWRKIAAEVQNAWGVFFLSGAERGNPRTYIASAWPSDVALGIKDEYEQAILSYLKLSADGRSSKSFKASVWTYFDIAHAHQLLELGQSDFAWDRMRWFWDNQISPGAYLLWEGSGEENGYGLWDSARGWTNPQYVTPHYWSAAEFALLQFDMLARMGSLGSGKVIVGDALPIEWRSKNLSVSNIALPGGILNWAWTNGELIANWSGDKEIVVQPGSFFPSGTVVRFKTE